MPRCYKRCPKCGNYMKYAYVYVGENNRKKANLSDNLKKVGHFCEFCDFFLGMNPPKITIIEEILKNWAYIF